VERNIGKRKNERPYGHRMSSITNDIFLRKLEVKMLLKMREYLRQGYTVEEAVMMTAGHFKQEDPDNAWGVLSACLDWFYETHVVPKMVVELENGEAISTGKVPTEKDLEDAMRRREYGYSHPEPDDLWPSSDSRAGADWPSGPNM